MKPVELIIRSYVEYKDGVWQAFCLNFDLAAQGESPEEAQEKIIAMIQDYVYDALAEDGADREFASQLLTRKAPWTTRARYYWILALCKVNNFKKNLCSTFDTVLPLAPTRHA